MTAEELEEADGSGCGSCHVTGRVRSDDDEILIQGLMWTNGRKLEFSSMLKSSS